MGEVKTVSVGGLVETREWLKGICVYEKCRDSYLNSVFREEQRRAGLRCNITLQTPEIFEDAVRVNPKKLGSAARFEPGTYVVLLSPNAIERYSFMFETPRRTIRHELAHIKYGDCDRNLPNVLRQLHTWLVEEPRAFWYEFFG